MIFFYGSDVGYNKMKGPSNSFKIVHLISVMFLAFFTVPDKINILVSLNIILYSLFRRKTHIVSVGCVRPNTKNNRFSWL